MNLLDHLTAQAADGDVLRGVVGTVTATSSGVVTLSVLGGSVPNVPVARSYASPTVGDQVLVVKIGPAWLALTALG